MSDLTKKVLRHIQETHVSPKPKWQFQLWQGLIWGLLGLSVTIGSIAFGVIIFQLYEADWDIYSQLTDSLLEFILLIMPYFWLISMVGFGFLTYHYFRQTKTGYKYSVFLIITGSVFLSLLGGGILYASGLSERLENTFQEKIPFYEQLHPLRHQIWMMPEKGFLLGKIIAIEGKSEIIVEDPQGQEWIADISDLQIPDDFLRVDKKIKIKGEMREDYHFQVYEIRPEIGRRRIMRGIPPHMIRLGERR